MCLQVCSGLSKRLDRLVRGSESYRGCDEGTPIAMPHHLRETLSHAALQSNDCTTPEHKIYGLQK